MQDQTVPVSSCTNHPLCSILWKNKQDLPSAKSGTSPRNICRLPTRRGLLERGPATLHRPRQRNTANARPARPLRQDQPQNTDSVL
eukprot:scaffold13102_cov39-Attheya_sp.AAC.2